MTTSTWKRLTQQAIRRCKEVQPIAEDKPAHTLAQTHTRRIDREEQPTDKHSLICALEHNHKETKAISGIDGEMMILLMSRCCFSPVALNCQVSPDRRKTDGERREERKRKREAVVMDTTHSINSPGLCNHTKPDTPHTHTPPLLLSLSSCTGENGRQTFPFHL